MTSPEPAPFRYWFRVRFGECDAQKVVFNARYADYVDLAVLEFTRALGYGTVLIEGPLDYQIVRLHLQWKSSARFDQVIEATVALVRLGTTSFTLGTTFRQAVGGQLVAEAESVYVLVDARTLEKTTLPDDFRAALMRGAPGVLIDHAGVMGATQGDCTII